MATIWLLLGLAVIAQAHVVKKLHDEETELKWPAQYTLKAVRTSLTDNVIETYEVWRTPKRSRIDYNGGYVKSIVKRGLNNYKYGVQYTVFPTATESQEVETSCLMEPGKSSKRKKLESILPEDPEYYTVVGNDAINDVESVKFEYNDAEGSSDTRQTIWAAYDEHKDLWIPVRYEILEFNNWLGRKDKHEVWDFFSFQKSFSIRDVFDADSYDCEEIPADSSEESSEVKTSYKNLLLMNPDKQEHVDNAFHAFKTDYDKNYADEEEHALRRSIFRQNMRRVIQHNRQNLGYKMALNYFSDKTPEEMKKHKGLHRRPEGKKGNIPFPYDDGKLKEVATELPKEYDARLLGLVTKVKNQEDCGSCWTYGTTAAVEGALARANGGRLMSLSNQAVVDCAWSFGAGGCNGGTDTAAYEWMMEYGLPTEAEYGPYLNQDGVCHIKNMTKIYPIRGYTDVTPLSIEALKIALVNHGPLSVSIHVSDAFGLYSSGIFYDTECSQTDLDHEVTLVGYGEKDGDTFWILKNSWGPEWGIAGYMYISTRDNNCGVATEPTYVVI